MTRLPIVGKNLRKARKQFFPKDTLADFALRISVSRATLQKMEQGDLSVAFGKYYGAAKLLGLTAPFHELMQLEEACLTIKARYDVFLKTAMTGVIHAADCVIEEEAGLVTRVGFRYREDYLKHDSAFPIDPIQLPLNAGEKRFQCQGGIPAFIDDYLPDAWGRKVLKRFNVNSVIDCLPLLGRSHIGALSLVPFGTPAYFDVGHSIETLGQVEQIAQLVDNKHVDEFDLNEINPLYLTDVGTGVGGTRPKALLYDSHRQYLAKFNRLSQDVYNHARVELACLNMARAAGLNVGEGDLVAGINGREVLLLERFDIAPDGNRYHLITVNGLLKEPTTQCDLGSALRYDEICTLLQHHSISIKADLQQLLRLMLFNRAISNTDDHARNFSLIQRGEGYQLAPAYDLVPNLPSRQHHAAGFGAQPYPPTFRDALNLSKIFGLSKTCVARTVEQVVAAVALWPEFAKKAGVSEFEHRSIMRCFHL